MPPHRDRYKITSVPGELRFLGRLEGIKLVQFNSQLEGSGHSTADFNYIHDYVYVTPVHEDGECHEQVAGESIIVRQPVPASTQELEIPPAT